MLDKIKDFLLAFMPEDDECRAWVFGVLAVIFLLCVSVTSCSVAEDVTEAATCMVSPEYCIELVKKGK